MQEEKSCPGRKSEKDDVRDQSVRGKIEQRSSRKGGGNRLTAQQPANGRKCCSKKGELEPEVEKKGINF